jgi:hypothetical protein
MLTGAVAAVIFDFSRNLETSFACKITVFVTYCTFNQARPISMSYTEKK